MMIKKITTLILINTFLFGLTGCSLNNKDNEKDKNETNVKQLYEEYIKDKKYKEEFTSGEATEYTYKDINDDGIEELIIGGTFEKDRVRTLIVSYNKTTKKLYKIYNLYSSSGLMYDEKNNTMLFIDRSSTTTIKYNYLKSHPETEGLEAIKDVVFKVGEGGLKIKYPDGLEEDTTAISAREESEKYTYVGFDHNMDGTTKETTTRDIFEAYKKDAFYVNDKKISYGLYKEEFGLNLEIALYPDGTCRYNGISNSKSGSKYNVSCTYEATKVENSGTIKDGIKFNLNSGQEEEFEVNVDNNISSQWLSLKFVK